MLQKAKDLEETLEVHVVREDITRKGRSRGVTS